MFDDFAHHPTAIDTTLRGARALMQEKGVKGRLLAVFEPRSNTMKMGTLRDDLPKALGLADAVWCYSGGVDWDVAQAMQALAQQPGVGLVVESSMGAFFENLLAQCQPGDWVVVMSNGSFGGLHGKLMKGLAERVKNVAR